MTAAAGPDGELGPRYGSDLAVETLADEGVRYVALNPGAAIRGLHESVVHASRTGGPSVILCCHEEIAVGLAHGYAKTTGTPMAVGLHDVVGLQHASMAVFNAWCDKAPVVLVGGTGPMTQADRRPGIDWIHTAYLQGAQVREYVKWDNQVFGTASIEGAMRRAVKSATTLPHGPVYVCLDVEDQEAVVPPEEWRTVGPLVGAPSSGVASEDDVVRLRTALAAAEHPVLIVDHYNTSVDPDDVQNLIRLAETWAVPVVDTTNRFNFPSLHELNLTEAKVDLLASADLVIALDVRDLYSALRRPQSIFERGGFERAVPDGCTTVSARVQTIPQGSWVPDYFTAEAVDVEIAVSGASLVRRLVQDPHGPSPDADRVAQRRGRLRDQRRTLEARWEAQLEEQWDAAPISGGRLAAELRDVMAAVGNDRWVVANWGFFRRWPQRLWDFQPGGLTHIGGSSGGGGLGYGLSASLGAALACKDTGRIALDIQGDGDLMYVASGLWTAAKHRLPLLVVVENNRTYYQDRIHQTEVADARGRGRDHVDIGIDLDDPAIDHTALAASLGLWVPPSGPVEDPEALHDVLLEAADHVRRTGGPALVDVVTDRTYSRA